MVAIVSRRQWGAAFAIPGNRHVAPSARRWVVVHWPGGGVSADEAANVRSIERFHRSLGWQAAPGYNFLVGQSGAIFEGCGRDVRGIHSPPRNADGWGVCVLSPLHGRPAQAALDSTRSLYDHLCQVAGRTLAQSWHGQHVATACAGPDLNRWVQQGMPANSAPPPEPEEPFTVVQFDDIMFRLELLLQGQRRSRLIDAHGQWWLTDGIGVIPAASPETVVLAQQLGWLDNDLDEHGNPVPQGCPPALFDSLVRYDLR